MGRKPIKSSPKTQSFFKVLSPDVSEFSQHLRIPPGFVKNLYGKSLRKCGLRGPSGTSWDVELERRENGLFFHGHGWQGFVKDHVLEKGDFLVFSYDGESNFSVTVFDRMCSEKDVDAAKKRSTTRSPISLADKGNQAGVKVEISDSESDNKDSESKTVIADDSSCDEVESEERRAKGYLEETTVGSMVFKSANSCFMETYKRHLKYRMMIPKKIAIREGHMSKKSVTLEDPSGRSWLVKLRYGDDRLLMTTGLIECCTANQISFGDTIIFECVKKDLIQIHIFKAGDKRCPVELVAAS